MFLSENVQLTSVHTLNTWLKKTKQQFQLSKERIFISAGRFLAEVLLWGFSRGASSTTRDRSSGYMHHTAALCCKAGNTNSVPHEVQAASRGWARMSGAAVPSDYTGFSQVKVSRCFPAAASLGNNTDNVSLLGTCHWQPASRAEPGPMLAEVLRVSSPQAPEAVIIDAWHTYLFTRN